MKKRNLERCRVHLLIVVAVMAAGCARDVASTEPIVSVVTAEPAEPEAEAEADEALIETPPDTVRVSVEDLIDFEKPLPENTGAIGLGELAPDPDTSFCEAFATAPARYVSDSIVPVQFWVDSFSAARSSVPHEAAEAVDTLLEHGQGILDWNFKRRADRPGWNADTTGAAVTIANVAVAECDDLPMIVGPPGDPAKPYGWDDLDENAKIAFCEDDAAELAEGIAWYVSQFGATPVHQEQVDTASDEHTIRSYEETGEFPEVGVWHFASDYHGIGPDGAPAPPPGGGCDL